MSQWGIRSRKFAEYSANDRASVVEGLCKLACLINDKCGLGCFVTYGTLLGTVRKGHLIPHDFDCDLCVIAEGDDVCSRHAAVWNLIEVLRTRYTISAWRSNAHISVHVPLPSGEKCKIDLFLGWLSSDGFNQHFSISKISRDTVFPLRFMTLAGRAVPVPNRPGIYLQAIYGEGWGTEQPEFSHNLDGIDWRTFSELSYMTDEASYWTNFYAQQQEGISHPTAFARTVADHLPRGRQLKMLDAGAGNCRDSRFFRSLGHRVEGMDRAVSAELHIDCDESYRVDVNSTFDVIRWIDTARIDYDVIYARFLLHSITAFGQRNFWQLCRRKLASEGRVYVECRVEHCTTGEPHYRRIQSLDEIVSDAESCGLEVAMAEQDTGWAIHGDEDPLVARLILR